MTENSQAKFYLFIRQIPNLTSTRSACINVKERDKKERIVRRVKMKKRSKVQRMKPPTPSRVTDALIGDEDQMKEEKKKRSRNPTQLPWTIWSPLMICMDHPVGLF